MAKSDFMIDWHEQASIQKIASYFAPALEAYTPASVVLLE